MSSFHRHLSSALLALGLLASAQGVAMAHSHLIGQTPTAGSTLAAAPTSVSLVFDGRVELPFSRISVTGPDGQPVAAGKLDYASDDRYSLKLPLPDGLASGRYRVDWQITSADSHKLSGQYDFTIQH